MLGFSPISGAPISGLPDAVRTVTSARTVGGITNTASITLKASLTASQTVGGISQFTASGILLNSAATVGGVTQNATIQQYSILRGAGQVGGIVQTATLKRSSLIRQFATVGGITQQATMSAFWNLPDCGWIPLLGDSFDALSRHMVQGTGWLAWRWLGKTAYKFASASAKVFDDAVGKLCELSRELDPRTAEAMLPEWEAALSLPDACLPVAVTSTERRRNIWFRLQKRRWSSAEDWKDLAAMFGLKIEVTPGWYVQKPALYQMCYPKRYDLYPKLGRFRVYVDVTNVRFPGYNYGDEDRGPGYPIPYGYFNDNMNAFMCLIDRVRPANVVVIWNEYPTGLPCVLPFDAIETSPVPVFL